MKARQEFQDFFAKATGGRKPYPYQIELACGAELPELLDVPTGLGKTAAAILSWLFRRRDEQFRRSTPRRLVYCLPMRTLVEQTESAVKQWRQNLDLDNELAVHVLMGGREAADWDRSTERDAVLIGTQDMILSRALNRGYGMSRYRWPMHFGLLNNDCLWVIDETQLMGVGLTTTAQLQGLRDRLGAYAGTRTLWMSATLDTSRLNTVDHPAPESGLAVQDLSEADRSEPAVIRLLESRKPLQRAAVALTPETEKNYSARLASAVLEGHESGTLTLVVLNQVARAQLVFRALQKLVTKQKPAPDVRLVHSRFRAVDRRRHQAEALDESNLPEGGRIVVATQAIEAGVDLSARTLFTELAPWSSLVQRFGRCNRRGECGSDGRPAAAVYWIDVQPGDGKQAQAMAAPYEPQDLDTTRGHLQGLTDVGPVSLKSVQHTEPRVVVHTLRRKDLLDLWDTTPDLAGNDLDVSRYIRESENADVQFFWREWDDASAMPPVDEFPRPSRDELCSVSIGRAKEFIGKKIKTGKAWNWNPLDRVWSEVRQSAVRPGMVLLLHVSSGGYDEGAGWTGEPVDRPMPHPPPPEEADPEEAMEDDATGAAMPLTQHLIDVANAAAALHTQFDGRLDDVPWPSILTAARWHDVGKAHPAFQAMLRASFPPEEQEQAQSTLWAKSRPGSRKRSSRRGFRHELASALAWLHHRASDPDANLIAYLIAAHHGKVRASIRSLPMETVPPEPDRPFARGIWHNDELPPVDLGNGETVPETRLSLELMRLGEGESGPSWLMRILTLRDSHEYGPFRLAFLETLVRIADWRGSAQEQPSHAD